MTDASATAESDSVYMQRALTLARQGWGQTAPNPMVGAVVVATTESGGETDNTASDKASDNTTAREIVGEGFHARFGGPHAEVVALAQAGARARGATLYITLEPCAHHGKTPPCADAVIAAGIARVVVAVRDPNAIARGGVDRLRAAGVQVDVGAEREAAVELNAPFIAAQCRERPWVTLKLALSAEGAIADPLGVHRWITGDAARLEVHRQRANSDAIAVGVGTVIADDPSLTVRGVTPPRVPPLRVVFDSTRRTPLESALVRTARNVPTHIFVDAASRENEWRRAMQRAGVRVTAANGLDARLHALFAEGVHALYVEGGARLAGSLLRASLVDRLIIFQSSLVLGARAPRAFAFAPPAFDATLADRRVVELRQIGDDVMTIYALEDVPCSPD